MFPPTYFCNLCKRQGPNLKITSGWITSDGGPILYKGECEECIEAEKQRASYPRRMRPATLFDEWTALNRVLCPYRARFDVLREALPQCTTIEEARDLITQQGFGESYPLLPEKLPVEGWVSV